MIESIYVHIPFCEHICSYCDFSKVFYKEELVNKYLDMLEIELSKLPKDHDYKTIYIGGGTPSSLTIKQLTKLFSLLDTFKLSSTYEFTIECNIENITEEKLKLFKHHRVNRLSIGVESFKTKKLAYLERNYHPEEIKPKIELAKQLGFNNINIDLMYAIPNETLNDINEELDQFLALNIPHLSIYSLIIEDNTKLGITNTSPIDEELDRQMYDLIHQRLVDNEYVHYEISNFAKPDYESIHNLTYWQNKEYYGIGLGASGYIGNIRYTNTKSIQNYLKGKTVHTTTTLTLQETWENEIMLGFRINQGINKSRFLKKYKFDIKDKYPIKDLLEKGIIIENKETYTISPQYWYLLNEILLRFIEE